MVIWLFRAPEKRRPSQKMRQHGPYTRLCMCLHYQTLKAIRSYELETLALRWKKVNLQGTSSRFSASWHPSLQLQPCSVSVPSLDSQACSTNYINVTQGDELEIWYMPTAVGVGLLLCTTSLLFFKDQDHITRVLTLCVIGFFIAVVWILTIVNEVVGVLQVSLATHASSPYFTDCSPSCRLLVTSSA